MARNQAGHLQRRHPTMTEPELTEGTAELSDEERACFLETMAALREREVPFLIAGAYGVLFHTGFWRGTKDLDLLVLPEHRDLAVQAVASTGMRDMLETEPYDPAWIYRSRLGDVIVDVIWQLPNRVGAIEADWFERAAPARLLGTPVQVVSAADLIWMKLFVFQRDRCDWPDVLNVIRGTSGGVDWDCLVHRLGPH